MLLKIFLGGTVRTIVTNCSVALGPSPKAVLLYARCVLLRWWNLRTVVAAVKITMPAKPLREAVPLQQTEHHVPHP
jgi:hypothetical protein